MNCNICNGPLDPERDMLDGDLGEHFDIDDCIAYLKQDLEVARRDLRERDELLEHLRDKLAEERALLRNTRELLREACNYLEATRTHSIFWFGWSHKAKAAGGDS